jgi:hypothetical protein
MTRIFKVRPVTGIFFACAAMSAGNVCGQAVCRDVSGRGALDSARLFARQQYVARPSDPEAQMAFGRLLKTGDSARSVYKKVIAHENAPDSLRAEAYFRLACISYMAGSYGKAEAYCASACSLDRRDAYERLHDRTIVLLGRDSLERSSKARKIDSLRTVSDTVAKSPPQSGASEKKDGGAAWYLQIAAFAELENAQGLKKDLLRLFPRVLVKEGANHGKTVFRVRIGPFPSNKEAQAYGDSALVRNKISFRVVED